MIPARTTLSLLLLLFPAPSASADDTYSTLHDFPCVDDTDVVGYRRCPPFGEWGDASPQRHVFVEYGVRYRRFASRAPRTVARTATPSVVHEHPDAFAISERLGVDLLPGWFAAVDVEMGNFDVSPDDDSRSVVLGAMLSLGLRANVAPMWFGVELGGGIRGTSDVGELALHAEGVLEARVGVGFWFTPWVTLGATAGASLVERGDWMMGLALGGHSHAFGGR